MGVPVIGYRTDRFPAFFTRDSGLPWTSGSTHRRTVARLLATQWSLGYPGGAVVANPIPEAQAMAKEEIDAIIDRALGEAARQGITGKRVTPFLLARLKQLTGGRSLAGQHRPGQAQRRGRRPGGRGASAGQRPA